MPAPIVPFDSRRVDDVVARAAAAFFFFRQVERVLAGEDMPDKPELARPLYDAQLAALTPLVQQKIAALKAAAAAPPG